MKKRSDGTAGCLAPDAVQASTPGRRRASSLRASGRQIGRKLTACLVLAALWLLAWQVQALGTQSRAGALMAVTGRVPALPGASAFSLSPSSAATADVITPTGHYTISLPLVFDHYLAVESGFGMQIFGAGDTAQEKMADLGARWVRLGYSWNSVEPANTTPDEYHWPAALDAQLAALSARHFRVILLLGDNPTWAATYRYGPIDLAPLSELTEFMQAAVARYSQPPFNIKHWEMYNEADNGDELYADSGLALFGNDPQAYVDILQAVYGPVKAVDPNTQILFSGIRFGNWQPFGPFVPEFLDGVLSHGGGAYFDMMNFHHYFSDDVEWSDLGHGLLGKMAFLQDKLASYGVYKPFLCSETGWWSDLPDGDPEVQAWYTIIANVRAMSAGLGPVIWFQLMDDDVVGARDWGLLTPEMVPKPSYYAYRTAAAQLAGARFAREWNTESQEVEAYQFSRAGGTVPFVVAWTDDWATHPLIITALYVDIVDRMGTRSRQYDGDDGLIDGKVKLLLTGSPVFVYYGQRAPVASSQGRAVAW